MVQYVMDRSFSPEKVIRMLSSAETSIVKTTPIRMMLCVAKLRSIPQASARISRSDPKANSIAIAAGPAVSSPGIVIPSTMDRAAPNAAPEDTPSVEPSASGLRSRPCIAAPHRLRAAPISPAHSTRGRRVHQMMER